MLILDAFNVLHASFTVGLGRLNAAQLRALIARSRWAGEHTVLVFDGSGGPKAPDRASLRRPIDAGLSLESRSSGISEVYAAGGVLAGGPGDADTVIESLIEREEQMGRGRLTVVVSSDKRIRAAAAGARARSLTSEAFLKALVDDARKSQARERSRTGDRPHFATDEGADEGRAEYWIRELGVGERAEAGRAEQECVPQIDPDDVDMGEILRRQGEVKPPPREDEEDDQQDKRRGKGRR